MFFNSTIDKKYFEQETKHLISKSDLIAKYVNKIKKQWFREWEN